MDEIIGQEHIVSRIREFKRIEEMPHLLFSGPPGTGKTSVAYTIAKRFDAGIVELNASDERKIDDIREKVKPLSKTAGRRIILLDEADRLTSDAQNALRRIMETSASEVKFILTCNEEWRIIEPIKSRCAIFRFRRLTEEELATIAVRAISRCNLRFECDREELKEGLLRLAKASRGDARKLLNELDKITISGVVRFELLSDSPGVDVVREVISMALDGDWEGSLRKLEDAYLLQSEDAYEMIEQLYNVIQSIEAPLHIKLRLYERLGETERNIRLGCNPLIQLASFLATVWVVKHVPEGNR